VLREFLFLGRALEESGLEAHVLQATGRLYLLDLHPKAKEARFVPYELGPEQCRRFLWVGDPPASNAPRDRATTKKLAYLLPRREAVCAFGFRPQQGPPECSAIRAPFG
jgi:CRISPR-associated protein Csh1